MANGIRTGNLCGFNKGRSLKFREGSRVRQTPEEGWRTYRPKRCGNDYKDEVNSPKTLNDKNHQASSQKFRQLISLYLPPFTSVLLQHNHFLHCARKIEYLLAYFVFSISKSHVMIVQGEHKNV